VVLKKGQALPVPSLNLKVNIKIKQNLEGEFKDEAFSIICCSNGFRTFHDRYGR
jgi:hypothetical protein